MTTVEWVMACIYVVVLGLTVVAAKNGQETVSNTLQRWAWNWTWFAYLMGVLNGHWFVPTKWLGFKPIVFYPWVLIPMGVFLVLDLINKYAYSFPRWSRWPLIYLLLGIPSGALLWGS